MGFAGLIEGLKLGVAITWQCLWVCC